MPTDPQKKRERLARRIQKFDKELPLLRLMTAVALIGPLLGMVPIKAKSRTELLAVSVLGSAVFYGMCRLNRRWHAKASRELAAISATVSQEVSGNAAQAPKSESLT